MTSRVMTSMMAIVLACNLSACDSSTSTMTIPAVKETISQTAETLNVDETSFQAYLDNVGITHEEFIQNLNNNNQTAEDLKSVIEESYDCTFQDYMDTIMLVNIKDIPENHTVFKSKYSLFNTYIASDELENDNLVNYDMHIEVADEANDTLVFDMLTVYSTDICAYMDYIEKQYNCKSVELDDIDIYGRHGVTKPEKTNPCMDKIFVYDENTNEILAPLRLATATLHFDDDNENITLALSNDLGLIFKTTGTNSKEKMNEITNLNIQIRNTER